MSQSTKSLHIYLKKFKYAHTSASPTLSINFDSFQPLDTHAISQGSQQPEKASDNLTPYSRLRHLIGFRKP